MSTLNAYMVCQDSAEAAEYLVSSSIDFAIVLQTPDNLYHFVDLEDPGWSNLKVWNQEFVVSDHWGFYGLDFDKLGKITSDYLQQILEDVKSCEDAFIHYVNLFPEPDFDKYLGHYQGWYKSKQDYGIKKVESFLNENCSQYNLLNAYITINGEAYFYSIYNDIKYAEGIHGGIHVYSS